MKKIINYLLFGLLLCCVFILNTNASTFTYTRTDDNLRVPNDIAVDNGKKFWIMRTPSVDEKEKIYDFALLIDDNDESKIFEDITNFINKYNMDMVVVTINTNTANTSQDYADNFFDYNYFGKNSSRDGILLLIDMDNREVYISTSGKGQLIYDDARIDNMLDSLVDYLATDSYDSAVNSFISDATKYAKSGVPFSNRNYKIDENGNYIYVEPFHWFAIIAISLVITLIVMFILTSKHKLVRINSTATFYLDKNTINIKNRTDKFITTHTTSTVISSSSSSGSRGGSSTHRSSSGRSHGGGGRRF